MDKSSYDRLKEAKVDAFPILADTITCLLKSIKRRIKPNPTVRSPWQIQVKTNLHSSLFWEYYKAIKNWSSGFGRTLYVERKKNGFVKSYQITFHHKGTLEYHLGQGAGESVKNI